MADRLIDKAWFARRIKEAGFPNQGNFAEAVGLSPSQLSYSLSGKRRVQADEAIRMAEALRVPTAEIYEALGLDESNPWELELVVAGILGAMEEVTLYPTNDTVLGDDRTAVPFVYGGHAVRVQGAELGPRFRDREVLGARLFGEAPTLPPQELLGRECFVETEQGRILFRLIQPGRTAGTWTLISHIYRIEPLYDVRLRWIAPLEFHLPAGGERLQDARNAPPSPARKITRKLHL